MKTILFYLCLLVCSTVTAIETASLDKLLKATNNPFAYDLHPLLIPAKSSDADVVLMLHGVGSDYRIAEIIDGYKIVPDHLISFNFPDYSSYGTIQELLPPLYLLKKLTVDGQISPIHLYGFSAGAGAAINLLAVLNTKTYDAALKNIGITENDKKTILNAIQKGYVLLDAPLKSFDEIARGRPNIPELNVAVERYRQSGLRPIDSVNSLSGLKLNVILFLQTPDAAVMNLDDDMLIERLIAANPQGKNIVIRLDEGGHLGFHRSLWNAFLKNR